MPTQIIDNFDLNSPKPIDNRLVVGSQSFYVNKDVIPFKYPGMRVWDLDQGVYGVPYVWTGTTFSNESSSNVSGGGTTDFVPVFTGPSTLGDSIIYQSGVQVAINNGTSFTPGYTLTVNGGISTIGSGFKGDGYEITNLNGSNILTGTISLARLANVSSTNWILTSGSGGPNNAQFTNPNSLTVGKANQLTIPVQILGVSFNGTANVSGNISQIGTITFGNGVNKVTLEYQPSSSKTVRIPSLTNPTSTIAIAEQPNTFTGNQTINTGTVIINKNGEALRLSDAVGGNSHISYFVGSNESAKIGTTNVGNLEIENRNVGNTIIRVNTATLASPTLVNRLVINSGGVRFSDNGTPMKTIVTGTVRIYQNGTAPDIIRGTGFTLPTGGTNVTSGNQPYITVQTTASLGDFVVVANMDGAITYTNFNVGTQKTFPNTFQIRLSYRASNGALSSWSGSANVSFICIGL